MSVQSKLLKEAINLLQNRIPKYSPDGYATERELTFIKKAKEYIAGDQK